ncbi:hypothetical protein [Halorarum salinum]|uniref:hypothetical protein n=1 Tax=Halorarum salinum TaxID=2743089 RepID=UPI001FE50755|nr:hypothetical protein [Halobaculum salinum]
MANHNGSSATLRIKLTDATTGEPIHLADSSGDDPDIVPISGETRAGHLTLNGDRIEPNRNGTAVVAVHEPGTYSVRYHPGSWLSHDPAYARNTASVSWHPLLTISGLATFTVEVVWWSLPFVAALYGGLRLGKFLKFDEYR